MPVEETGAKHYKIEDLKKITNFENTKKVLRNINLALHRELSKQSRVIKESEKYQKERDTIIADNKELNNKVKELENEYKEKST